MKVSGDIIKTVCKIGQGKDCCAFISVGPDGFECLKNTPLERVILARLREGTMNAQGIGGWEGCLHERN